MILYEKIFNFKLSGNEVFSTNVLLLLIKIMLCSKLHHQIFLNGNSFPTGSCVGSVKLRPREREFFINYLLVRIHLIIMMIRWIGLAPWEFELCFSG